MAEIGSCNGRLKFMSWRVIFHEVQVAFSLAFRPTLECYWCKQLPHREAGWRRLEAPKVLSSDKEVRWSFLCKAICCILYWNQFDTPFGIKVHIWWRDNYVFTSRWFINYLKSIITDAQRKPLRWLAKRRPFTIWHRNQHLDKSISVRIFHWINFSK